jgi:tetratricopeptide (TPR) repeat protein
MNSRRRVNSTVRRLLLLKRTMKRLISVVALLLVAAHFIHAQDLQPNEIPKYGGIKKTPEMIRNDQKFIDGMIQDFGSRDKAADDAIRRGFAYLAKADWRMAIKRFNQAWLLSPDKPEIPWGFGASLSYEGKFDEAEKYFQEAQSLTPKNARLLTDFGFLYQFWATRGTKDKTKREERLNHSVELFQQAAELEPTYERTYFDWAVSLYFKKEYADAWSKIYEAEKLGGKTIDKKFVDDLTKKMVRP